MLLSLAARPCILVHHMSRQHRQSPMAGPPAFKRDLYNCDRCSAHRCLCRHDGSRFDCLDRGPACNHRSNQAQLAYAPVPYQGSCCIPPGVPLPGRATPCYMGQGHLWESGICLVRCIMHRHCRRSQGGYTGLPFKSTLD